jgi:hypothetical protein
LPTSSSVNALFDIPRGWWLVFAPSERIAFISFYDTQKNSFVKYGSQGKGVNANSGFGIVLLQHSSSNCFIPGLQIAGRFRPGAKCRG